MCAGIQSRARRRCEANGDRVRAIATPPRPRRRVALRVPQPHVVRPIPPRPSRGSRRELTSPREESRRGTPRAHLRLTRRRGHMGPVRRRTHVLRGDEGAGDDTDDVADHRGRSRRAPRGAARVRVRSGPPRASIGHVSSSRRRPLRGARLASPWPHRPGSRDARGRRR